MSNSGGIFAIRSTRVLYQGKLQEATVVVKNGKIDKVIPGRTAIKELLTEDYGEMVIMPGLIDSHVHINEPGRTEWEGFETATKAAAAGGITTLVDMPLNSSPVSTTLEALESKLEASKGKLSVHCGFYAGLIPGNTADVDQMLASGKVMGVKAFLTHSGIDEFPNVTEEDLRKALPIIKAHNSVLLVHCELESENSDAYLLQENPTNYQAYLKSRPRKWEDDAIAMMIGVCREFDVRIHIVHLSSSDSIQQLQEAQKEGLKITVETCPQYLCINAEDIPDGGTQYKCAPPIREKENNDLLWDAVRDGLISMIVTDHSPAPPGIKELGSGDFSKAWGGIASLQFSLPVFWTEAKQRGFSIEEVAKLMSENVSEFLGLQNRKGKIEEGYDADLIVWNPEAEFEVKEEDILFRHKVTPYIGMPLSGKLDSTYLNGKLVFPGNDEMEPLAEVVVH